MVLAVLLWPNRVVPPVDPPSVSTLQEVEARMFQMREEIEFQATSAAWISGRARVIDGDTLDMGGTKLRLEGISAPEMNERGGLDAKSALEQYIGGWEVSCQRTGRRSYERWVAVCFFGRGNPRHGQDVAQQMVADGFALPCPRYSPRYVYVRAKDGVVRMVGYRAPAYCTPR
jgi:endonuclease YncB( thermonuclease family)